MTTAVSTDTIVRSSLRDQVLAVLRQRLVSGSLEPGEIYSAQAVAAELGVSGSPVREAMLTLVNQGLMEPVRNRGFRIAEISVKDRADILEMRVWLEVPAMGKLAAHPELLTAHETRLRGLAQQTVETARAGDLVAFLHADREFHLSLTDLLDNAVLTSVIGDLRDRTRLYGLNALKEQGRLVDSAQEHVTLLEAAAAGAASHAKKAMSAHLHHVLGEWAG